MKYKPLLMCLGVMGFMVICSIALSGSAKAENHSNCLNAKQEYPAAMSVCQKTSIESDVPSEKMITLPNAKREAFSKIDTQTANAL